LHYVAATYQIEIYLNRIELNVLFIQTNSVLILKKRKL